MQPANRPALEWRVAVARTLQANSARMKISRTTADGSELSLWGQEWASGAPTAAQLEELLAMVTKDLSETIVTRFGVQGVLASSP